MRDRGTGARMSYEETDCDCDKTVLFRPLGSWWFVRGSVGAWLGKIKSNVSCFVNHLICTSSAPVKSRQSESFIHFFVHTSSTPSPGQETKAGEKPRPVRPPSR